MGLLRLYLAICVLSAHSDAIFPWGVHSGTEAVQVFFIISGFYMQFILAKTKYESIKDFYVSRALRIFVPYWSTTAIVVVISIITGIFWNKWLTLKFLVQGAGELSLWQSLAVASNLTIFFQDWTLFFQQDPGESLRLTYNFFEQSSQSLGRYLWTPQAWSVGVELTFYLLAPFLCRRLPSVNLLALLAGSILLRFSAYSSFSLNYDPWTYRFFPFELAYFIFGILGCRLMLHFERNFDRLGAITQALQTRLRWAFYPGLVVAIAASLWLNVRISAALLPYAERISGAGGEIGYMVTMTVWIMIIPFLFTITRNIKADRWIGELSYLVYLLHVTVALVIKNVVLSHPALANMVGELTAILTIPMAILLNILVFQRFEAWRQARLQRPSEVR